MRVSIRLLLVALDLLGSLGIAAAQYYPPPGYSYYPPPGYGYYGPRRYGYYGAPGYGYYGPPPGTGIIHRLVIGAEHRRILQLVRSRSPVAWRRYRRRINPSRGRRRSYRRSCAVR